MPFPEIHGAGMCGLLSHVVWSFGSYSSALKNAKKFYKDEQLWGFGVFSTFLECFEKFWGQREVRCL